MNKKQKAVVLLGMIIILIMALYPPRKAVLNGGITGPQSERYLGYGFFHRTYSITDKLEPLVLLFSGDIGGRTPIIPSFYSIVYDYPRLAFQWALVLILTAGFLLFFSDKKKMAEG